MSLPVDATQKTNQPGGAPAERDAVIFIPGGNHEPGKTIREVSTKIAAALGAQTGTGAPEFLVKENGTEEYQEYRTTTTTIFREEGKGESKEIPLIDVYEMSYKDNLTGGLKNKRQQIEELFWFVQSLILNLIRASGTFVKILIKGNSGSVQWHHILLGGVWTILVVVYVLILSVTVVLTLIGGGAALTGADLENSSNVVVAFIYSWLNPLQGFVAVSAAIGMFVGWNPTQQLSEISTLVLSSANYLSAGTGGTETRSRLTKQLSHLLEHIGTKNDYRRIHLIAYSFGSIIALDLVFPPKDEAIHRSPQIDTLVTIGCPFSYIRMWNDYFEQRKVSDKAPEWLNVYVVTDLLATNFREQDQEGSGEEKRGEIKEEERGIMLETGSQRFPRENRLYRPRGRGSRGRRWPWGWLTTKYYSWRTAITYDVHYDYWGKEKWEEPECFELIVKKIYEDDHALS